MSRYVEVGLPEIRRDHLLTALSALAVPFAAAREDELIMLEGSLECAGEPVEIRLEAGVAGSVEDFGFVGRGDALVLVCGEHDRRRLEADLLPRVRHQIARALTHELAAQTGFVVDEQVEPDGTRRIALTRRP